MLGTPTNSNQPEAPPSQLSDLIAPMPVNHFLTKVWRRCPSLLHASTPNRFDRLINREQLDAILNCRTASSGEISTIQQGNRQSFVQRTERPTAQRVWKSFNEGGTIVAKELERSDEKLGRLCRNLGHELDAAVQVNAYLSPPASQGAALHFDLHDVLILQIDGEKLWRVYPQLVKNPTKSLDRFPLDASECGDPIFDIQLRPGDCLYIPSGFPHESITNHVASFHLTVGLHLVSLAEMLTTFVRKVGCADVRFRSSAWRLIQGNLDARNSLQDLIRSIDRTLLERCAAEAIHEIRTKIILSMPPDLTHISESAELDPNTRLAAKNRGLIEQREAKSGRELVFPGGSISDPNGQIFEFLKSRSTFSLEDLPCTDPHSFLKNGLTNGLLEVVRL